MRLLWFLVKYVSPICTEFLSYIAGASTSHPFFDNGQYVSRDIVYSIESKQIAVHSDQASNPFSHACSLQMSDGGSQLRKIMTSMTHSRTLTRTRNALLSWRAFPPRGRALPSLPVRGDHVFFRNFWTFCSGAVNCRERHSRSVRLHAGSWPHRVALCHDSHSPSFNAHPLHSNAGNEWDAVMNSMILVLDTIINSVL